MGCGFSADDSKASDEEGILDKNTSKLNKGSASQSNSNGSISDSKDGNKGRNHRKTTPLTTSVTVPINHEISSSQVDFFKMLDAKIEKGKDLEEHESELELDDSQQRHQRLQKVAEEWDTLLGRSHNSHDLRTGLEQGSLPDPPEDEEDVQPHPLDDNPAANSVDSMRTMFSNSCSLPAGTLREVVSAGGPARPAALGQVQSE